MYILTLGKAWHTVAAYNATMPGWGMCKNFICCLPVRGDLQIRTNRDHPTNHSQYRGQLGDHNTTVRNHPSFPYPCNAFNIRTKCSINLVVSAAANNTFLLICINNEQSVEQWYNNCWLFPMDARNCISDHTLTSTRGLRGSLMEIIWFVHSLLTEKLKMYNEL